MTEKISLTIINNFNALCKQFYYFIGNFYEWESFYNKNIFFVFFLQQCSSVVSIISLSDGIHFSNFARNLKNAKKFP